MKALFVTEFDHNLPVRYDAQGNNLITTASRIGRVGHLPANLLLIEADAATISSLAAEPGYLRVPLAGRATLLTEPQKTVIRIRVKAMGWDADRVNAATLDTVGDLWRLVKALQGLEDHHFAEVTEEPDATAS